MRWMSLLPRLTTKATKIGCRFSDVKKVFAVIYAQNYHKSLDRKSFDQNSESAAKGKAKAGEKNMMHMRST
ncbi:hypothetical protein Bca4012_056073 [Brassica carinata]